MQNTNLSMNSKTPKIKRFEQIEISQRDLQANLDLILIEKLWIQICISFQIKENKKGQQNPCLKFNCKKFNAISVQTLWEHKTYFNINSKRHNIETGAEAQNVEEHKALVYLASEGVESVNADS